MKFLLRSKLAFLFMACLIVLAFSDSYSQIKLRESFSGETFPPDGWSAYSVSGSGTFWNLSDKYCRTADGCATSGFDTIAGKSYLTTRRIVPSSGDSLVFYLRQTFYRVYSDTLRIMVSSVDSMPGSMNTVLLNLRDGQNYPSYQYYGRYSVSLEQYSGQTIWIAFCHSNINGEILRIDDVTIGRQLQNDVAVSMITSPPSVSGYCPPDTLIPEAVITNEGTLNQGQSFNIHCRISGPVNYQSTTNAVVESGSSASVAFQPFVPTLPGDYTVRVYTSLASDQNRLNDTIVSDLSVRHYTYGQGEGNYSFASSNGCVSTSLPVPQFCWKDMNGSIKLLRNGEDVSHGLLNGDVEDGYFLVCNFLPEGKKIRLYGIDYDTVLISVNGLLAFRYSELLDNSTPPGIEVMSSAEVPVVSPLWLDYTCNIPDINNEISYKVAEDQLIITFSRMHLSGGDIDRHISFQVTIFLAGSAGSNSEILFQYNRSQSGAAAVNMFNDYEESDCFAGIVSGQKLLSFRHKTEGVYSDVAQLFNEDLAIEIGPDPQKLSHKCSLMSLSLLLEGYRNHRDTIIVELRDRYYPQRSIEHKKFLLPLSGQITLPFTIPTENSRYYIKVTHRNSLETWSKDSSLSFTDYMMSYDFTTSPSMAYGSNQFMINGKAHIYSGDVNKDGYIDVEDGSAVDNDAYEYRLGYSDTDLNGDGIVDSWDMVIVDKNVLDYVIALTPLTEDNIFSSVGKKGNSSLKSE